MELVFPAAMPLELAGEADRIVHLMPSAEGTAMADYFAASQRVKRVDAQRWISIAEWGTRSGKLHWRQTGIATTLSGMAAQQWRKDPSPKQVSAAVGILNVVEEHAPEVLAL